MRSAKDVATRFTAEMDKTGICQAVVPVSGLLALTARTLRQSEDVALEKLAGVGLPAELLERGGLVALRDVIAQHFAQRSDLLKAHTALLSLRQFVAAN